MKFDFQTLTKMCICIQFWLKSDGDTYLQIRKDTFRIVGSLDLMNYIRCDLDVWLYV